MWSDWREALWIEAKRTRNAVALFFLVAVFLLVLLAEDLLLGAVRGGLRIIADAWGTPLAFVATLGVLWCLALATDAYFALRKKGAASPEERAALVVTRPLIYALALAVLIGLSTYAFATRAELRPVVLEVAIGEPGTLPERELDQTATVAHFWLAVDNLGRETAVTDWRVEITLEGGGAPFRLDCPRYIRPGGIILLNEGGGERNVPAEELLHNRIGFIRRGERVIGQAVCARGNLAARMTPNGSVWFRVTDINGREYVSDPLPLRQP